MSAFKSILRVPVMIVKAIVCLVRLPFDLLLVTFDYLRVLALSAQRLIGRPAPPCVFCLNPDNLEEFPRRCRSANKYGSLWMFRLACPCVSAAGQNDCTYAHCKAPTFLAYGKAHILGGIVLVAVWGSMMAGGVYYAGAAPHILAWLRGRPSSGPAAKVGKIETAGGGIERDPVRAQEHLERARELAEQEDFEAARIECMNARRYDPNNALVRLQLAKIYRGLDNWTAAYQEYWTAARLDTTLVEAHIALSEIMFVAGRRELSLKHARAAIEAAPDNVEPHLLLAECLVGTRDVDGARDEIATMLELGGDDLDVLNDAARLYVLIGDLVEAEVMYRKSIELDKDSVRGRLGLSAVYRFQNRPADATAILKEVEALDPEHIQLHVERAEIAFAERKMRLAVDEYRRAVEKDPELYSAMARLSELLINSGNVDEGFRLATDLVESSERSAIISGNFVLARMYRKQGVYSKVTGCARAILDLDGDNLSARLLLAEALMLAKEYEKSAHELRDIIDTDPTHFEAGLMLARVEILIGNDEQGIAIFQMVSESYPDSGYADLALANYYHSKGWYPEAIVHYRESIARGLESAQTENNLATLLLSADEDIEYATRLAESVAERYPKIAVFQDTLAWAHYKSGRTTEALEILDGLVETLGKIPEFHYHYGAVLLAHGEPDRALEELKKAIDGGRVFPGLKKAILLAKELEAPPPAPES